MIQEYIVGYIYFDDIYLILKSIFNLGIFYNNR